MAVAQENITERPRQHPRLPIHEGSYSFHRRQEAAAVTEFEPYTHSIDKALLRELATQYKKSSRVERARHFQAPRELGTLAGGLLGALLASNYPTLDVHWILCVIVFAGVGTIIGERLNRL